MPRVPKFEFLGREIVAEVCISGYIEQADRMRTWEALNFDLIFDLIIDALIQVTESHMHELIMESVISVSSEYFERVQKLEIMKLIAKDVKVLIRNLVCGINGGIIFPKNCVTHQSRLTTSKQTQAPCFSTCWQQ